MKPWRSAKCSFSSSGIRAPTSLWTIPLRTTRREKSSSTTPLCDSTPKLPLPMFCGNFRHFLLVRPFNDGKLRLPVKTFSWRRLMDFHARLNYSDGKNSLYRMGSGSFGDTHPHSEISGARGASGQEPGRSCVCLRGNTVRCGGHWPNCLETA